MDWQHLSLSVHHERLELSSLGLELGYHEELIGAMLLRRRPGPVVSLLRLGSRWLSRRSFSRFVGQVIHGRAGCCRLTFIKYLESPFGDETRGITMAAMLIWSANMSIAFWSAFNFVVVVFWF